MASENPGPIKSVLLRACADWRYSPTLPEQLYTAEQCRAIDAAIIESGIPSLVLMKRAARAAFQKVREIAGAVDAFERSIFVFCGKGNNAGDGYLLAQLATDAGYSVTTVELAKVCELSQGACAARATLLQANGRTISWADFSIDSIAAGSIIVDAILGTGTSGAPRKVYAEAILAINQQASMEQSCVIALDLPSGLCSDSGMASKSGAAVTTISADYTISFIAMKRGLVLGDAREYAGEITLEPLLEEFGENQVVSTDLARCRVEGLLLGWPGNHSLANKYTNDAVVVIGGDHGMGGAPLMSAVAALRLGAGLVKLITRPEHTAPAIIYQPELLVQGIDDHCQGFENFIPRQVGVICVGPGLGQTRWAQQLLLQVLILAKEQEILLIVDADGLNLIASNEEIRTLFIALDNTIITPHLGEAKRLQAAIDWPTSKSVNQSVAPALESTLSSVSLARMLSEAFNTRVVLKGPATLCVSSPLFKSSGISEKKIRDRVCPYGNSMLATAGTGDVLAGMIAAASVKYDDIDFAIEMAVTLHAAAADLRRIKIGSVGFTATETISSAVQLLCAIDLELDQVSS